MKLFRYSLVLVVFSLVGCIHTLPSQNLAPDVTNAIAYCNGGIDAETGVKIQAAVAANGGQINAALNDKLQGLFLAKTGFTSSDALVAQKQYMDCLEKKASQDKDNQLDACSANLQCELDLLEGLCTCRTTVEEFVAEKHYPDSFKFQQLKANCYSGQFDMHQCWQGKDPNSERAACTVKLQKAGRMLPSDKDRKCLAKEHS